MTAHTETVPEPAAPEPAGPEPAGPEPVARVTARPYWAPVPQVNLLPPEILAKRRFRRLQKQLAGVAVGVVVLCGVGVAWAQAGVAGARNDLEAIQDQGRLLQSQQAKYAGVPVALAELDRVKAAREGALGTDVAWYRFLSDLAVNTPPGTELSSVAITMNGQVTPAAATVPLAPAGLGLVKVSGKALKFTDVAAWLDSVDQVHGLAGSGLDSATKSGSGGGAASDGNSSSGSSGGATAASDEITFNGSAIVVPAALSHRYDRKAS